MLARPRACRAVRPGDVFVACDDDLCARALDNLLVFAIELARQTDDIA